MKRKSLVFELSSSAVAPYVCSRYPFVWCSRYSDDNKNTTAVTRVQRNRTLEAIILNVSVDPLTWEIIVCTGNLTMYIIIVSSALPRMSSVCCFWSFSMFSRNRSTRATCLRHYHNDFPEQNLILLGVDNGGRSTVVICWCHLRCFISSASLCELFE